MKNLLILLFLVLPLVSFSQDTEPSAQVGVIADSASAAERYNLGDYLGAALAFDKEVGQTKGDINPYLLYNLGNSYFKAGDPDKAIINYYRAYKILPRDKDIRGNLIFALNSTGQRLVPEGLPVAVFNFYNYFSMKELNGLMWIFAWLFSLSLIILIFTSERNFKKHMLIASGAMLIFFGAWYFVRLPSASQRIAVAVSPRAEVRSGPGESFPVSLSIPRAHLVVITDAKGDWAEIEVGAEKATGWVLKKSLEEI